MSRRTVLTALVPLALGAAVLGTTTSVATAATAATGTSPSSASSASSASSQRAASGSLVFIKGYNVYVARADGTGARRLTTDGSYEYPYLSPSQADNGLIVTSHKGLIYKLKPSGKVVGTLNPRPLENSAGDDMDGTPADVRISPNGQLIAYTFAQYACPSGIDCDTRFATGYTRTDELSDPAEYGVTYYNSPEWIGNTRTVQGGGAFTLVNLHDLGQEPMRWFSDSDIDNPARDLTDPVVSRDGKWVATIRGYDRTTTVLWSRVNGSADPGESPDLPTPWCETNEEPVSSPTFSADSTRLAWVAKGDIYMTTDPSACHQPRPIVKDAKEPSFSGAAFTTPAPDNLARPTLSGRAKVGKVLHAGNGRWTPAPTSYSYQWLRAGKPIAGATKAAYKLTRKDAGKAVSVRVVAHNAGGSATATSAAKRVAS